MTRASFITFEGGEGSGKSTQALRLADRLRATGRDVLLTREPGGSPFAEKVRALLLDPSSPEHSALSEALLFYAARADHLDKTIRPALTAGRWVVCDRFSDSTRVYQGVAGGMSPAAIDALEEMIVGATKPDLTVILDLPAEQGLARATQRRLAGELAQQKPDTYEKRDLAFHESLRAGYAAIARREPERCVLMDGSSPPEAIAAAVWALVEQRLLRGTV